MKEIERPRQQANELEAAAAAYREVMEGVRVAGAILEATEPTMAALIKQYEWNTGTSAIFNPGMFQRLEGDKNVEAQVRLAKAVVAFVDEWRALRREAEAELEGEQG